MHKPWKAANGQLVTERVTKTLVDANGKTRQFEVQVVRSRMPFAEKDLEVAEIERLQKYVEKNNPSIEELMELNIKDLK